MIEQWLDADKTLNRDTVVLATFFVRFGSTLSSTRNEFCKNHGLNTSEFDVLATLFRSGSPYEMTATELKERTLLPSSGALSNRIDRLDTKFLVERKHDHLDKRSVKVSLTAEGIKFMSDSVPDFFDEIGKLFERLDDKQIAQLKSIFCDLLP